MKCMLLSKPMTPDSRVQSAKREDFPAITKHNSATCVHSTTSLKEQDESFDILKRPK
jgi:hypothetical protein